MSVRGTVTDYAGEEIFPGDLITYPSRQDNGVRASDAIVLAVEPIRVKGWKIYMLKVQPTGTDSGNVPRKTLRVEHILPVHARLIRSNVTGERG